LNVVSTRKEANGRLLGRVANLLLAGSALATAAGCASNPFVKNDDDGSKPVAKKEETFWDKIDPFKGPKPPPPPAESRVLRVGHLETDKTPEEGTAAADLLGAKEFYRLGEYDKAESVFHRVADNTKNATAIAEEARYYEAECLRLQLKYPKAADTYNKTLQDFPSGAYREQATQRMYEIATFWLEDTKQEMRQAKEKREGERWFVAPHFIHFDKTKPFLDEEGRALEKLEQVRYNDMTGPLADRALFYIGGVKFFNEDYRDADNYFSQLCELHKNSEFYPKALELAIMSKHLSTGGAEYDGRKVAEARLLIDTALRSCPELASQKSEFLNRQLVCCTLQQAEKEYNAAEFWRRTGHPGSAYFYYGIVRNRYPGTKYFDMATERMHELRGAAAQEQSVPPPGAPRQLPDDLKRGAPLMHSDGGPGAEPRRLPDLGQR